jgi:hypothetical protein
MIKYFEKYNTGTNNYTINYGVYWSAQPFPCSTTHYINKVRLLLSRTASGGIPGIVTVSIKGVDGSNNPTGADLCSGTIDGNVVAQATASAWYQVNFTPTLLSSGTNYAIVVRAPSGDATDACNWLDTTSASYTYFRRGSSNSGSTWSTTANVVQQFEEWGAEPTATAGLYVNCYIAFGSNTLAVNPTWTDVTADLMSISTSRGRQYEMNRIEAGTATIVLKNLSGNYWPTNSSGANYPNVLPVVRISIQASYNYISYDVYTGYVYNWAPSFIMQPIKGPVMTLSCVDFMRNLSCCMLNTAQYNNTLTGDRVISVLGTVGWLGSMILDSCDVEYIQTTGANVNVPAIKVINDVQDAFASIFFMSPDGVPTYQGSKSSTGAHSHRATYSASSLATFGDNGGSDAPVQAYQLSYDDVHIYNDVRMQILGSTNMQVATVAGSQTIYGVRSYVKTGLIAAFDSTALATAQAFATLYGYPHLRAQSITVMPSSKAATLYPLAFTLEISNRITVRLTQAGMLSDYYIEQVNHGWQSTSPQMWMTSYQLSLVV